MKLTHTIVAIVLVLSTTHSQADAAAVSFLGSLNSGSPGPLLGTLPRNFVLTLNYTPNPGGGAPATGTLQFFQTPNANSSNTNVHPELTVVANGNISVGNNSGPGGTDVFSYNGQLVAGLLGPNNVNFSFSFLKPADTINSGAVTPTNIAPLIGGQSTINFIGGAGGPNASGAIRGAPEPSSMIALMCLVVGGCGVGYRKRRLAKQPHQPAHEAAGLALSTSID